MERQSQWYHFKIITWLKFLSFSGTVIQKEKLPFPDIFKHFFILTIIIFRRKLLTNYAQISNPPSSNLAVSLQKEMFLYPLFKTFWRSISLTGINNWLNRVGRWLKSCFSMCKMSNSEDHASAQSRNDGALLAGVLMSCRKAWWGPQSFPLLPKSGC